MQNKTLIPFKKKKKCLRKYHFDLKGGDSTFVHLLLLKLSICGLECVFYDVYTFYGDLKCSFLEICSFFWHTILYKTKMHSKIHINNSSSSHCYCYKYTFFLKMIFFLSFHFPSLSKGFSLTHFMMSYVMR